MNNNLCINWNIQSNEIIETAHDIINKSKEVNNNLCKIEIIDTNSAHKFISLLSDDITEIQIFQSVCGFLQYVGGSQEIRQASFIADLNMIKHTNELNFNKNIYDQILKVKGYLKDDNDNKFIYRLIKSYERNGITLQEDKQELLIKIRYEISKLENAIVSNINEYDNKCVEFHLNDLYGLPENIINSFNKISSNKISLNLNQNNYNLLMKYVDKADVRKSIEKKYAERYDNMFDHISKLLILRDKHAKLLSYNSHSDYKACSQMTKNAENIKHFLLELLDKLNYRYQRELETLFTIMKKYNNNNNYLNSWDLQYYIMKWKCEYGINENILREYFELNHTLNKIFQLYETIFNIKFSKTTTNYSTWHQSVEVIKIENNKKELLGYLYLDLYARDGKYSQTRCFCLQPPCIFPNKKGKYLIPTIALISSFTENALNNKTLLAFYDVISLFHELGHVMHYIFAKNKYILFSGLNVENDFVETPAQVLDLLCWEKDIIKYISSHFVTKKTISDDMINKIVKLKNLELALHYKKHILISLFDQILHSSGQFIDTCEELLKSNKSQENKMQEIKSIFSELHIELYAQIFTDSKIKLNHDIIVPNEWITFLYGSDSQYYSSIWSRVMSSDIYIEKIKGKPLNSQIGQELVNKIFKYGGSKPAYEMICDYINRKPEIDGFISMHNLDTEAEYSFFLNTDQIQSHNKKNHNQIRQIENKPIINDTEEDNSEDENDTEIVDSVSNRFSEIIIESESCVKNKSKRFAH